MSQKWRRGEYAISTDGIRLDLGVVHGFLTICYWAAGIPPDVVKRSMENSLCLDSTPPAARSASRERSPMTRPSPISLTCSSRMNSAGVA